MVTRVATVAFEGIEARAVDVQVQPSAGGVNFVLVGLGDKAVAESKERVRSALIASGLALPARRLTVNLAPAIRRLQGEATGKRPVVLRNLKPFSAVPERHSLAQHEAKGGRAGEASSGRRWQRHAADGMAGRSVKHSIA
jgi:hypothetical protein